MGRKNKGNSGGKPGSSPIKTKAVDLVTGKETIQYFFDPRLLIPTNNLGESSSSGLNLSSTIKNNKTKDLNDPQILESRHLFVPCSIVKPLDDDASSGSSAAKKNSNNGWGVPFAGPTLVKTEDGTLHKITDSTQLILLRAPDDYIGMDDVLHLSKISEASLLHSLRIRYKRDQIYTQAGQILISINPYKNIMIKDTMQGDKESESIYSLNQMIAYRAYSESKGVLSDDSNTKQRPPHLYQIADRAYAALKDSVHVSRDVDHMEDEDAVMMIEHHHVPGMVRNQSIIISGESGSGKTEATKYIMQFLARTSRKIETSSECQQPDKISDTTGDTNGAMSLEDRVLSCNPLLETFGNAQTLRNHNSSRFGKFIRIDFSTETGSIVGASISNYLLEKTRITTQVDGERNYHIFYQLFAGTDSSILEQLGLDVGSAAFKYLGNRQQESDPKVNEWDAKAFEATRQCLAGVGLSEEEQTGVFSIAAAVLHLGNISFEENLDDETNSESAKIKEDSMTSLQKACKLLGLDESDVKEAILTKALNVNGKIIKKSQNVSMAEDKRDALAKLTYSSLFVWLVKCVNDRLAESSASYSKDITKSGFIGVLDIYGFEFFDTNGFEQLLINYCNEKLQRHFNRHLFEVEQELYANEGVDWSYISFNDNRPCLELIEGGGSGGIGILNALDDAWGGMGTMTEKDGKFVAQLHKMFGTISGSDPNSKKPGDGGNGHPNFITPKFGSDRQFMIIHYAGEVRYTADCFVEKNMETLSNELKDLGEKATAELSKRVYATGSEALSSASQRSTIRGISVGSQFRTSLQALVLELENTQPHYIRCIKPNLDKAQSKFLSGEVLKQLRYSGMMEAIRIRQEGYALREDHEVFFDRFSVLLSREDIANGSNGILQLVQALSKWLNVSDADWQVGHTKIFLRRELSEKLERLAKLRVLCAARCISRFSRSVVHKRLSRFLVAWARLRLIMLAKKRRRVSSTKISSAFRTYQQKRIYRRTRAGYILLQSHCRRKKAFQRVRKIRDPYCDMTFVDCKRKLINLQSKLDTAVKEKEFRKAALLEAKILSIQEAIETKRPITRGFIDQQIESVQKDLNKALDRKAFTECAPLQDKLEELLKKQAELPTIDELRASVTNAEAEMALAASKRDFAAAAEAQNKVDKAKEKLSEALSAVDDDDVEVIDKNQEATNGISCESRAQLELDIASISLQIKEAIDTKDFSKASMLQSVLEEREKLRAIFPTIDELLLQLNQLKKRVADAINVKDFVNAGKLSEEVSLLEKKIEEERSSAKEAPSVGSTSDAGFVSYIGENIAFSSRIDLEKLILDTTNDVSNCVATKDFKKAEQLQTDLDKMIELRGLLPSISELRQKISSVSVDMKRAIDNKKFSDADQLHIELERLERQLEKEISLAPLTHPDESSQKRQRSGVLPVKTVSSDTNSQPPSSKKSISSSPVAAHRSVAKLRPAMPTTCHVDDCILEVVKLMTRKRTNACVVLSTDKSLVGIITSTDVTRRVVAKSIHTVSTPVSVVMTPNPTCVEMSDSAMDALTTMVNNNFRHLPVVQESVGVVGLLDIAKCLNDAITKLEHVKEKGSTTAEDVIKLALKKQGGSDQQAAALQALLGGLLSQTLGNTAAPTLRRLLADVPKTIVSPDASILEAGKLMADRRKAALVVENGVLVGVFGFKDMMTRAVAMELPLDTACVKAVMTPNPEFVSPDITVLEALQIMHDNRFLTLPVCEADGKVVGLVDVMDVVYGCGGTEGWKSVFSTAMDEDDASDVSSNHSFHSAVPKSISQSKPEKLGIGTVSETEDTRPVAMLRPSKPILSSVNDSILMVAMSLAEKRGSASVVTSNDGVLAGIMTGSDMTRRVIAKYLTPSTTSVSNVMTKYPTCVAMTDSAMDAIATMVENKFRHLPVTDNDGILVGVLDIAKCLNAVIGKLEKKDSKNSDSAEDAVKKALSQHVAVGSNSDAIHLLLSSVLSQAFGASSVPTLRTLLGSTPRTVVSPSASVREAGLLMSERRQAALVVDEKGLLVGLFGFKDMMTRVIAKDRSPDSTMIADVMTPNPEAVLPDITVLEALQIMHDNRFLTLPVCEDDGRVMGIVNVMDVIAGCGGAEGWRSMFSNLMEATDDASDSVSVGSTRKSNSSDLLSHQKEIRSVSRLRPAKPLLSQADDSVLAVTKMLQQNRGSASLIVDGKGSLAGIITDTDITRRVVANNLEASSTAVSKVMTAKPLCVRSTDSGTDALITMVENRFRHLPVVDGDTIVGILDIAKCLNDAISRLDHASAKGTSKAQDTVNQILKQQGGNEANDSAMHALLSTLLANAFGTKNAPTLRSLLANKPQTTVAPSTSIREAAILMSERRKAALIVHKGELVGIFGFKDMMTRAVANEMDLESTTVEKVMTPNPETASPDITVLEALQIMHDHHILTLPVCEENGDVVGLVDVMDVIHGCGGTEGWRSIFSNAMDLDDMSVSESGEKSRRSSVIKSPTLKPYSATAAPSTPFVSNAVSGNAFTPYSHVPTHIPTTLEFKGGDDNDSFNESTIGEERGQKSPAVEEGNNLSSLLFKVIGPLGETHRVRCGLKIRDLLDSVSQKIGVPTGSFQIQYEDDEGDVVVMTSDDDVAEAWNLAKRARNKVVKVTAMMVDKKSASAVESSVLVAGIGVLGLFGLIAVALLRPKR